MKTIPQYAAMLLFGVLLTGCCTTKTIDHTKTKTHTDESTGETVVDQQGKSGYYALLPFAVAGDVALTPVYVGEFIGAWFIQSFH